MSIKALLWRGDGSDEAIDLDRWQRRTIAKDELLWIDTESPDGDALGMICDAIELSDKAASALETQPERPAATVHSDAVEIVVRTLVDGAGDEPTALQILIGKGWIITRHDESMPFLDQRREGIRDEREVGLLTAVQFLVSVLDWHVDSFFQAAEELEERVDDLDEAALRREDDLLDELVRMRRRIARVRRTVSQHRELFAELARPDFLPDLEEREASALAQVTERLERAAEAVSHVREMLIGTFDVHMTRTAQRTNDIMKILTLASVILLPSSVLAGIMGMNFKVPFFDLTWVFWLVVAGMVMIGVSAVLVARWRGWL